MALKGFFDSQDEAPAFLREHVVERDGKWVLEVEGYVTKDVLDGFRTNNRQLKQEGDKLKKDLEGLQSQLSEVQGKYKDIDIEEYHTLKASPTDTQRQIAEAEKRFQAKFDAMAEGERQARKQAEESLNTEKIRAEVAKVGSKMGVLPTALSNLQRDATDTFGMVEGLPQPLHKGEPRFSEKSPSKYMDVEEWVETQVPIHPEYFGTSTGGGAAGGLGGRSPHGRGVIAASDSRAFLANLEKIAKGEVEVDMTA